MICLTGKYAPVASNRIKELREARGMTLEKLAELVGLSTSYVRRLENGRRNLAVKHFDAFASALNVEPVELVGAICDGDSLLIEAVLRADPAKKAAIAVLIGLDPGVVAPKEPTVSPVKGSAKRRE